MYQTIKFESIEVNFQWSLNGGGIIFADEFVHEVAQKVGKVGHAFEYCAGPGFIGFALLAHNLCDKLTLADINPQAVAAVKETIRVNRLEGRVSVYQSDCLDAIPATEKWDLVISNPPWHIRTRDAKFIRVCDPGGRVHKKFYENINKYLAPNGTILFFEGAEFTSVNDFKGMIEGNGLTIVSTYKSVPISKIFSQAHEYPWLSRWKAFFLRFALSFKEAYFIWIRRS